jgi:proteasome lid subunit RPN8/RPN11
MRRTIRRQAIGAESSTLVTLVRAAYDEILAHAQGQPNEESCGILGGNEGRVERVFRGRNVAKDPRTRFEMDPQDIRVILEELDNAELDLIGFYHSHVHTSAHPSPTDIAVWPGQWYPDALCFICSLADEERPELRAFHIGEDRKVTEETISIAD